jgi:hypothetical protein
LTAEERRKVQAFAESLIANRTAGDGKNGRPNRIDVDKLYGMFADIGGDKTDKELLRESWDDVLKKFDD